jgi:hypothetical protein
LLISSTSLFRFGEVTREFRPDQRFPFNASNFRDGFVNVSDFSFRTDRDQWVKAGFNQRPGVLGDRLLLPIGLSLGIRLLFQDSPFPLRDQTSIKSVELNGFEKR